LLLAHKKDHRLLLAQKKDQKKFEAYFFTKKKDFVCGDRLLQKYLLGISYIGDVQKHISQ